MPTYRPPPAPRCPRTIGWAGPARPRATLAYMKKITLEQYTDPSIVEIAVAIAARAQEKNVNAIAAALMEWLRKRTRFVPDAMSKQLLTSPLCMVATIRAEGRAGGDCADIAMLSAALALAVNLTPAFVAEAFPTPGKKYAEFAHVFTIVQTPLGWVNFDTQRSVDLNVTVTANQEVVPIL